MGLGMLVELKDWVSRRKIRLLVAATAEEKARRDLGAALSTAASETDIVRGALTAVCDMFPTALGAAVGLFESGGTDRLVLCEAHAPGEGGRALAALRASLPVDCGLMLDGELLQTSVACACADEAMGPAPVDRCGCTGTLVCPAPPSFVVRCRKWCWAQLRLTTNSPLVAIAAVTLCGGWPNSVTGRKQRASKRWRPRRPVGGSLPRSTASLVNRCCAVLWHSQCPFWAAQRPLAL